MKTVFTLLRVTTGMMAGAGLLLLLAIVLFRSGGAALKEGVGAIGYTAKLFTSGFTEGTPPKQAGWVVALPQVGLALLFAAMLVSTFYPDTRILLHLIAIAAVAAVVWYVRMAMTAVKLEIACVPLVAMWYGYYATCVFWSGNQPAPPLISP